MNEEAFENQSATFTHGGARRIPETAVLEIHFASSLIARELSALARMSLKGWLAGRPVRSNPFKETSHAGKICNLEAVGFVHRRGTADRRCNANDCGV
jgi:hypothetical protein